ncbi:unnamed protein product [Schistosoma margrebowiei]|uniref:Uncharacterized protein n=1 Tax=Schistosoma margrebowiei TaxID=48269 RepID=A0AA85AK91_9TREM|nr:unnamed protein product [Schistosoma margrebowiei]
MQEIERIIPITFLCKSDLKRDGKLYCTEPCYNTLFGPRGYGAHDGKPYCQIPCYQALFGPKGYGSVASSHIYK